jgi:predicted secreted hydrolase
MNKPLMSLLFPFLKPKYAIRHERPLNPIALPKDDAAHYWAQSEWWYYTGRLTDQNGRAFGFELTFFKRITGEDTALFLPIPAHWLRDVGMVSHFAVTDLNEGRFAYKTIHNLFRGWRADPDGYHVAIGGWSARKHDETHLLSARMEDYRIELSLVPKKPPVLHGKDGIVGKGGGHANYYYSYSHMDVGGTITTGGRSNPVVGKAWMDHEYGTISVGKREQGWDWFGIRLDDGSELMVNLIRDPRDESITLFGTYVDERGRTTLLSDTDLRVLTKAFWYSHRTHSRYPAAWEIRVAPLDFVLDIRPLIAEQELVTRPIPYWEGIVGVAGTRGSRPVTGHGYVELVGYSNKTYFHKYSAWISENSGPSAGRDADGDRPRKAAVRRSAQEDGP